MPADTKPSSEVSFNAGCRVAGVICTVKPDDELPRKTRSETAVLSLLNHKHFYDPKCLCRNARG